MARPLVADYDFSKLTRAQQELLTFQGWCAGCASPAAQPGKSTVKKLIERGLVVPRERKVHTRFGEMTVIEYEVPIAVHMAWCQHCSDMEARRHVPQ